MTKMKLEAGIYEISDDCTVVYQKRKVIVKKMKSADKSEVKYCADCIHQKLGKRLWIHQERDSYYCDARPKSVEGLYYCAPSNRIACYKFKEKGTEE